MPVMMKTHCGPSISQCIANNSAAEYIANLKAEWNETSDHLVAMRRVETDNPVTMRKCREGTASYMEKQAMMRRYDAERQGMLARRKSDISVY